MEPASTVLVIHAAGAARVGQAFESLGESSSIDALERSGVLTSIERVHVCAAPQGGSVAIAAPLVGSLPRVRAIVLEHDADTVALRTEELEALRAVCEARGAALAVEIALDRDADAFAALRGAPTSLAAVLDRTREIRGSGLSVRWRVPILPDLVYRLEALWSLAEDEEVDAVLGPPVGAPEPSGPGVEALDSDLGQFLWDFVAYRLLEDGRAGLAAGRITYLEALAAGLHDRPLLQRRLEPAARVVHAWPDEDGAAWTLRGVRRPAIEIHSGDAPLTSGEPGAMTQGPGPGARVMETAGVFIEGGRALAEWAAAGIAAPLRGSPALAEGDPLPRVLVIGAYGGEHIGDAAILGGVLLRIHARHGTRNAILMSQRPEHTRHLVPMLDLPVAIEVDEHDQGRIADRMSEVDAVVFAGGPMMDIPKQLVKHFYAVSLARRQGKPFIVEGIGAGPFLLGVSEWVARRLVRMAASISVRTATDGAHRLVGDLDPVVGRDPAFDYLATRPARLTRVPDHDAEWLDTLLRGTEGRLRVAINLRPIRHIYTVAPGGDDPAAHTRAIEDAFERHLAGALMRFHDDCAAPPCFVFYTMNGIQFGSSDLRSAYRVARRLEDRVDFRVWEADPGVDAVVDLLRHVDVAIAMRFHGAIFAISQDLPVIGIDYRIGKRDKVHALLEDFGQSDHCARVDQLEEQWLYDQLCALAANGRTRSGDGAG